MSNKHRLYKQAGAGDSGVIILLFVVCIVISVTFILLDWMGSVREQRAKSDLLWWSSKNSEAINIEREPHGHQVTFKRGLLGFKASK